MKISTKGRYAVRCVLNLAIHRSEDSIPISRISKQENISANYIEQLFLKLKKEGLVISVRGRNGGYRIGKKPQHIKITQIIEAVEGPIIASDCVVSDDCARYDICTTKYLWKILSKKVKEVLDKISLQDLCNMARDKFTGDLKHKLTFNI